MKDSYIFTEDDKFKPITTTKQSIYMLRLMRGGIKGCRQYEKTEEDKMINVANCEALAVAIHSMEQLDLEILKSMRILHDHCESHPTCENCDFRLNHKGCAFRFKTPREWF